MIAEEFLQQLHQSLGSAVEIRSALARCVEIGGIPNQAAIEAYVRDLDVYINANKRIAMQCAELYSPGPKEIAIESLTKISGVN